MQVKETMSSEWIAPVIETLSSCYFLCKDYISPEYNDNIWQHHSHLVRTGKTVIMLAYLLNIIDIVIGFNYLYNSANIYLFQNTCEEVVSNVHLPNRHWQLTHKMVCEYLKWNPQCWMDLKSSWTPNSFHHASILIMQIELIPILTYSITGDAINFSIQTVSDAVYVSITLGSSFSPSVRYMV
jgi:hypothetical protein